MQDIDLFSMLGTFLNKDLDPVEREQVFTKTIPQMVERAKDLKSTKPPQGLHFSLQQQGIAISRDSPKYSENRNYVKDIYFVNIYILFELFKIKIARLRERRARFQIKITYLIQVIASNIVTPLSPP